MGRLTFVGIVASVVARTARSANLVLAAGVVTILGCSYGHPKSDAARSRASPISALQVSESYPSTALALAPVPDKVQFVDITRQAGIHWHHYSGARGKMYMPEIETPGCAFIDYDNDGKPDILLLNDADWPEVTTGRVHSTLALYHNDGNGHFTDVTAKSGLGIEMEAIGVAVGDYDNDGYDDLYITCVNEPSHLFHNDHNGHFTDVTKSAGVDNKSQYGTSAAWLDYDRDGKLDLVVGNYCQWSPASDKFCSVYQSKKSYCTPSVYNGESVRLYHNNGGGKFSDVTAKAGLTNVPGKTWGVLAMDMDGDGWPDIVLSDDMEPNCYFHNEHNGTFKEIGIQAGIAVKDNGDAKAGMGIDAADIDNSGRPSILVSNFTGEEVSLFQNMGNSQFQEASHPWKVADPSLLMMGWGVLFLDYDLDGRVDALVCDGHIYSNVSKFQPNVSYKQHLMLFHNDGGTFSNVVNSHGEGIARPMVARGSAYADIDGDGDLDLLVMENNGTPRLLRNDGGNTNHWLRVHTVGVKSNRDGIGAKVECEAGGVKQTRWVTNTHGFTSCSELTVTFGLGQVNKVDKLTVTWPSGQVDTYQNLPVCQALTATEGGGVG